MGLKLRRDTAANWTANNPVLEGGEQGYETDTGKLKIGDGSTAWASLGYWSGGSGSGGVPTSRQVATGTGLLGGGDLSADRTLTPDFGTGAGKVTQGNDSRLSDARTPTAHASTHGSGGSDPVALAESQVTNLTTDLAAKLVKASNLSDLTSAATARTNLGLGTVATKAAPPSTSLLLKGDGAGGFDAASPGVDYVVPPYLAELLSTASVSATSTETTLWTPTAIAALSLAAGQVYQVRLGGTFDNVATSGLFTVKIKINGTLVATIPVVQTSQTSAASGTAWYANVDIYVDSTGSGGGVTVVGSTLVVTTAGGGLNPRPVVLTTAVNLSTGLAFTVTGQTATANAGNVLRIFRGIAQRAA